ncbi:hypothetical protein H2200_004146 [Cladophialophora chaetospira]|uniref:F-box domain-containing protein n=1 Tax=Cladophialophora chaetospira TaxID=386627 RepID=A0AA38XGD6_9EURO|nr:hypothetical protein H2200_004146 [Cladophialophora chaetospira]
MDAKGILRELPHQSYHQATSAGSSIPDNAVLPTNTHNLPVEVLRLVLGHVNSGAHRDRNRTSLNAMLTCRLWYQICIQLFWTDVFLMGSSFFEFRRCPTRYLRYVRTLSIRIPIYNELSARRVSPVDDASAVIPGRYDPENIAQALESLAQHLKLMENREVFSLVVPRITQLDRYQPEVLNRVSLLKVLSALPASLRHLELDTNCMDYNFEDPIEAHLWPMLCEITGQLSNLRLRVGALCRELFSSDGSSSMDEKFSGNIEEAARRTIIISTAVMRPGLRAFRTCHTDRPYPDGPHPIHLKNWPDGGEILKQMFPAAQLAVQENKQWSGLARLTFFYHNNTCAWMGDHRYSAIHEVNFSRPQNLKLLPCVPGYSEEKSFLRYIDSTGQQRSGSGAFRDLAQAAEGNVWVETTKGYRLPYTYYVAVPRFRTSHLKTDTVTEHGEDETDNDGFGSLFYEEKEGKRVDLNVIEYDNLNLLNLHYMLCNWHEHEKYRQSKLRRSD